MQFDPCPDCQRTEFKDSKSRDNHLYYERHKKGRPKTPYRQTVSRSFDEQDIIERFISGEMGVQDAVNEFQSQWELSNPVPKDGYREWSAQRAKAVDAFYERLIRSKPRVSQSQSISQPQSQFTQPRQLTVTDLAELRAKELRGEIPLQSQSYQTSFYEQEQPVISSQPQQQSVSAQSQPTVNIVESLKSAFSRLFSRKQPQIPERPLNEYGMPASYHRCDTCGGAWINSGEVAIHLSQGHQVIYVPQ